MAAPAPAPKRLVCGFLTVKEIVVCFALAVPAAFLYRNVLVPVLAGLDIVRYAKGRGAIQLLNDAFTFAGLDLEGKDASTWSGYFAQQVQHGMLAAAKFMIASGWGTLVVLGILFILFLACLEPMINACVYGCVWCCRCGRTRSRKDTNMDAMRRELAEFDKELEELLAEAMEGMTAEERAEFQGKLNAAAAKRAAEETSVYRPPGSRFNKVTEEKEEGGAAKKAPKAKGSKRGPVPAAPAPAPAPAPVSAPAASAAPDASPPAPEPASPALASPTPVPASLRQRRRKAD